MSQSVFPSFPGLSWPMVRKPTFKTIVHRSVSGQEARVAYQRYPLYEFELSFEFLQAASIGDLQKIVAFYSSVRGSFDSFLYADPLDNEVVDQSMGQGDNSTTDFQLIRTFSGGSWTFIEPVQNVNTIVDVKVNGIATADYSISPTGLVSFFVAPEAGLPVTWSGSFYYRMRFLDDALDAVNFTSDLWELKKLGMVGSPVNKV